MKTRILGSKTQHSHAGKESLEVSAMGLGCMGMSEFYGPADEAESLRTLHYAIDNGLSFLDTADMYGRGANEELVGRAIADRRDKVVLATKFGIIRDGERDEARDIDGTPTYVRRACEASLKRLNQEVIDLYYLHRMDPTVPIEDTVGAMADLVAEGKVRHIGLSEVTSDILRRAEKVHPITALQTEYSLWQRDVEDDILDTCRTLGIGFVPYSPLGRGFLTGTIRTADTLAADDWRRAAPRFQDGNIDANLKLADKVVEAAHEKGCTPAQLALAWVMAQGMDIVPIPGTKRLSRLVENVGAVDINLNASELAYLDSILPKGSAVGARYPVRTNPDNDAANNKQKSA